jgi:hypothetical protein
MHQKNNTFPGVYYVSSLCPRFQNNPKNHLASCLLRFVILPSFSKMHQKNNTFPGVYYVSSLCLHFQNNPKNHLASCLLRFVILPSFSKMHQKNNTITPRFRVDTPMDFFFRVPCEKKIVGVPAYIKVTCTCFIITRKSLFYVACCLRDLPLREKNRGGASVYQQGTKKGVSTLFILFLTPFLT